MEEDECLLGFLGASSYRQENDEYEVVHRFLHFPFLRFPPSQVPSVLPLVIQSGR